MLLNLSIPKNISFSPKGYLIQPLISYSLRYPKHFKTNSFQNYIRPYSSLTALPFRLKREEANKFFISKTKLLEITNTTTGLIKYKSDPIKACFIPFHSVDISNIKSSYIGRYGIDRLETYWTYRYDDSTKTTQPVLRNRIVTDWYNIDGTIKEVSYPLGTLWSQIYAGFVYPRYLIENTLPTKDLEKLVPLTNEMINFEDNKKIVYPHEMNIAFALEKIHSRLIDAEKDRIISYLSKKYNADHVEINTLDVHLDLANIKLYSYYIPTYIYQSDIQNLLKYQILNAHNGQIHSNTIYSIIKSTALGMGVGGLLTLGFNILTRPYIIPLQIAIKVIISSSVTGLVSGVIAKLTNISNDKEYKKQMEQDSNVNNDYIETDDDKERREFSAMINEGFEYIKIRKYNLPIDKLKLLQLENIKDLEDLPSIKILHILKMAYHNQMRKWHPDLHPEKREIAEQMSKQINLAYKELIEIISLQRGKN